MFSYFAYGLSISAAMPLPELVPGKAEDSEVEGEVNIRFGYVKAPPSVIAGRDWICVDPVPQEDLLFWQEVGSFLVREGRDIVFEPCTGLDERTLRLFLLGPVLTVLLRQRGHLLLHASAVAVGDEAALFVGSAGWGKSTTAAALYARGHGLVTDDVAVLRVEQGCPMLLPGFPQLKLWPKTLVSLGEDPKELPRCNPRLEKRSRLASRKFSSSPLPLKRIYVLDEGDALEISPLRPQEALAELLRHTYGGMGVGNSSHFFDCASVIKEAAIRRLRRQKSLSRLPELARFIEDDLVRNP